MRRRTPRSKLSDPLFPYTTLFRSGVGRRAVRGAARRDREVGPEDVAGAVDQVEVLVGGVLHAGENAGALGASRALRGLIAGCPLTRADRSEEHTSELQSLMRISYAVFCLKKKNHHT